MTRIDFYILQKQAGGDRFSLACRVAEKALKAGRRVVIHAPLAEQARHIDRLLWTQQEQSFLPHGLIGESEPAITPILIGDANAAEQEHDVLINLASEVPTFFSRFERLAECVDQDQEATRSSRERYRWYRERGYPLGVHEIT